MVKRTFVPEDWRHLRKMKRRDVLLRIMQRDVSVMKWPQTVEWAIVVWHMVDDVMKRCVMLVLLVRGLTEW